ncbi:phosphotransferase family protein [Saccharothrix obliqua]|uniref:phosphotransferase family protein n=1 Tax=Saccharothrix obliqua TaxID=2861747 RepID=UPI001C5D6AD4|nr:aminoglycoside phosphotransferase family protein [Saccharothrix obliqua]MBW4718565.1 aminoglycoside phosphotransferase family protein [Saccharothrix obliqua]
MLPDLDVIDSEAVYEARRHDPALWVPWARHALGLAGLPTPSALTVTGGSTYPVVLADNGFVVKFYGEHWCGPDSHAVEREAYRVLAGVGYVPEVVHRGELRPRGSRWPWPFLVLRRVPGVPWPAVPAGVRHALAHRLGEAIRELAGVPLTGGLLGPDSTAFRDLLRARRSAALADHRRWGRLGPALLDRVELPDPDHLARTRVLVHGDLHGGNIFADPAGPALTGLIDFTDVYAGDPRYALVQLHLNAFRGDRGLLASCLDGMAIEVDPRDMLAFTLLHDFDVLEGFPHDLTGFTEPDDLAAALWAVP